MNNDLSLQFNFSSENNRITAIEILKFTCNYDFILAALVTSLELFSFDEPNPVLVTGCVEILTSNSAEQMVHRAELLLNNLGYDAYISNLPSTIRWGYDLCSHINSILYQNPVLTENLKEMVYFGILDDFVFWKCDEIKNVVLAAAKAH